MSALRWLIPLLVCPACRQPLKFLSDDPENGMLAHDVGCAERYPVIAGIPRLLLGSERATVVRAHRSWFAAAPARAELAQAWGAVGPTSRVVTQFDDEWSRFSEVGGSELGDMFRSYFNLVPAAAFGKSMVVLDAGSGAGRWAYEVGRRGPRVIAVDLGLSIEVTATNTAALGRVACIQADLMDLPIAPDVADWAYSLGVIHHLDDPLGALRRIVGTTKPGAMTLAYVYYSVHGRSRLFRSLFAVVDRIRVTSSRWPRPVTRIFADAVALLIYWPLARVAQALESLGLSGIARVLPLNWYAQRSFRVMRNDSLDRFGTSVERRYSRAQTIELLRSAGLKDVVISAQAPYWHGMGKRPANARE